MAESSSKGRRGQGQATRSRKAAREAAAPAEVAAADRHDAPAPDSPEASAPQATYTISSADLTRNIAAVIEHVETTGDRFIVTRYNKPVATITPNSYLGQTFAHVKLQPTESRREWAESLAKAGVQTGYTASMMSDVPMPAGQAAPAIDHLLHEGREVLGAMASMDAQMDPPLAASPSRRPVQRVDPQEAQRRRDALLAKINTSKRRG